MYILIDYMVKLCDLSLAYAVLPIKINLILLLASALYTF